MARDRFCVCTVRRGGSRFAASGGTRRPRRRNASSPLGMIFPGAILSPASRKHVRERREHRAVRMFYLQRRIAKERTLCGEPSRHQADLLRSKDDTLLRYQGLAFPRLCSDVNLLENIGRGERI